MKKFLIWVGVLLIIAAVFWLVDRGTIRWQPLTILVAALLAPIKFIAGLLGGGEEKIREAHRKVRERETAYQEALESDIAEREGRVRSLRGEVEELDTRLADIERQRTAISEEIEGLSASQLVDRGRRALG